MKNKFYLILSPINFIVIATLDVACLCFGYISVEKLVSKVSTLNIAFLCIVVFTLVIAVLSTVQLFKNGVRFYADRVEFTGVDNDNEFLYCNIEKVESYKDTAPSFRKNFVDRYSSVILFLNDGNVATISLGFTTKKTLKKIISELESRIH